MALQDQLTGKEAMGLVKSLEGVFKGFPHLPKGLVEFFVKIAPWMAGLGGLGSLLGGAQALFLSNRAGTVVSYLGSLAGVSPMYFTVSGIFSLVAGVLLLMAFSPLKERKFAGWMYVFWVQVLSILQSLVGLVWGVGGIVGLVIGALIGFYLVFEMKPFYSQSQSQT